MRIYTETRYAKVMLEPDENKVAAGPPPADDSSRSEEQEASLLAELGFSAANIKELEAKCTELKQDQSPRSEEASLSEKPRLTKLSADSRRRNVSFGTHDECALVFLLSPRGIRDVA